MEGQDNKTEERMKAKQEEQGEDKTEGNETKLRKREEEEEEETLLNESPKINKSRRKRNILVGWLCCRIVKAFVIKNDLL